MKIALSLMVIVAGVTAAARICATRGGRFQIADFIIMGAGAAAAAILAGL